MIFLPKYGSPIAVPHHQSEKGNGAAISHRQALELLLANIQHQRYPPRIQEELPAIVSHWLQSPGQAPILLGKKEAAEWAKIVQGQVYVYRSICRDWGISSGLTKNGRKVCFFLRLG